MNKYIWLDEAIKLRKQSKSWNFIAEELKEYFQGVNKRAAARRIQRAVQKVLNDIEFKENIVVEDYPYHISYKDGNLESDRLIEICETENLTPRKIVELHKLDPAKWEVIAYRNNYWHSQVKGGTRLIMYQSRLTVRPSKNFDFDDIKLKFEQLDRKFSTPLPKVKLNADKDNSQMAEVNISDLHLGKIYYDEVNQKILNSETTTKNWYQLIEDIFYELKDKPLEYIVFVWSNDFFNSDTINKTTTSGTPQDTDLPWNELLNLGMELLVYAVEKLSVIAPIKTFYVPSNHDMVFSYAALKYLEAWFRNRDDIDITTSINPRKYIRFGNTLIGYTHGEKIGAKGNKEKASKLASAMPVEAAKEWADTTFREMHASHLHSEQLIQEINGVIVRRISSPTFQDNWHVNNGFIGAVRKAQTFIYDKKYGLRSIINTPVIY